MPPKSESGQDTEPSSSSTSTTNNNEDSPLLYGFHHAAGLPGFEGLPRSKTPGTPQNRYLAVQASLSLQQFKNRCLENWSWELLPVVETALRTISHTASPTDVDRATRLQLIGKLRSIAQSGINFVQGLDLVGYGSFVSGLYTPGGDLDLCISGNATWQTGYGGFTASNVVNMPRDMQVKFLRAFAARLRKLGAENIVVLGHARIPIVKFIDRPSRIEVDVAINGLSGVYKSAIIGLLGHFDWRVGALVRLVKLWARLQNINDASQGTLNSFALTLMVIFHLQTRASPVLPAIRELYGAQPDSSAASRPLHGGKAVPVLQDLETLSSNLRFLADSKRYRNSETLLELLGSFFALYSGVIGKGWVHEDEGLARTLRPIRIDTWNGVFSDAGQWDGKHADKMLFAVEDPFDSTDNCARTVRDLKCAKEISTAFKTAADAMASVAATKNSALQFLRRVFGKHAERREVRQVFEVTTTNGSSSSAMEELNIESTEVWFPSVIEHLKPPEAGYNRNFLTTVVHDEQRGGDGDIDDGNEQISATIGIDGQLKVAPVDTNLSLDQRLELVLQEMEGVVNMNRLKVQAEQAALHAEEAARRQAREAKKAAKIALKEQQKAARRAAAAHLQQQIAQEVSSAASSSGTSTPTAAGSRDAATLAMQGLSISSGTTNTTNNNRPGKPIVHAPRPPPPQQQQAATATATAAAGKQQQKQRGRNNGGGRAPIIADAAGQQQIQQQQSGGRAAPSVVVPRPQRNKNANNANSTTSNSQPTTAVPTKFAAGHSVAVEAQRQQRVAVSTAVDATHAFDTGGDNVGGGTSNAVDGGGGKGGRKRRDYRKFRTRKVAAAPANF